MLLDEQLSTALELASETAVAAGRLGVLFCWDEAHILRDSPRQRQFPLGLFLAAMARAQREGQPLMLVLGGVPSLTENLSRAKSYTERMFQAEALGVLQPPEDLLAFSRPLELAGREYDSELPPLVRQDSGGYPFQIQFAGALLWDAVSWPERITTANYRRHRAAILDAFDRAFFEARLARTSRAERAILQAVAASGESAAVQDVLRLAQMPNQSAQQLIARLRDKGLVYRPERGRLAFTLPLLGDYLRRRGASK